MSKYEATFLVQELTPENLSAFGSMFGWAASLWFQIRRGILASTDPFSMAPNGPDHRTINQAMVRFGIRHPLSHTQLEGKQ